ncbi:MAG: virulence protein RhuM/Fic/DOC family protein [bacterium]
MSNKSLSKGEIIIYQASKKEVGVQVRLEKETVWLSQMDIAKLFSKDRSVITKHINTIFADKEVDKKSNVQKLHVANSDKPIELYSLDVVLAIGYRTNSARAIGFRRWATRVLKDYLLQGYALNKNRLLETQKRFQELQATIFFFQEKSRKELLYGQSGEILRLLADYAKTLTMLEQYDQGRLTETKGRKAKFVLEYSDCLKIIAVLKKELIVKKEASDLFGLARGGSFEGIIKGLYQAFGGRELYPSIEDKAAHLLYFVIKDHPFVDGNKRSASFLFVYLLDKTNYLFKKSGERKINDNALVALALLVAESEPREKETMIKIIKRLIARV